MSEPCQAQGIDTSAGSRGDHDRALIAILAAAHAGELAAAYAYRGHWRSRWGPARWDDRREIQRIEAAEWHHRSQVHDLLDELGSGPVRWRELLMGAIGRFFGALCVVGGRFGPMYAAGRLEAMNVGQYVDAAGHARAAGRTEMALLLEEMVAEEARHEAWFGDQVRGHPLLPVVAAVGGWRPVAPSAPPSPAEPDRGTSRERRERPAPAGPDALDGCGGTDGAAEAPARPGSS